MQSWTKKINTQMLKNNCRIADGNINISKNEINCPGESAPKHSSTAKFSGNFCMVRQEIIFDDENIANRAPSRYSLGLNRLFAQPSDS
jgi:hypothetical protein